MIQASIWNWRTYAPDAKGNASSNRNYEGKIPKQGIGAEQLVVVMKTL
jgi:hypothetical protein